MTKAEALLGRLMEERLTQGADIARIDERIREEFEQEWCVVFTSMNAQWSAGQSRTTIDYLCLVHEMKRMTRPIIEAGSGLILKVVADRFLAIFRRPHDALAAMLQVNRRLTSYNDGRAQGGSLAVGAGIGFGRILKLGNEDVFGREAALALRLGGDVAQPYEILVSDAARAALLHAPGVDFEVMDRVPGLTAFRAVYDLSHPDSRPARVA